MGDIKAAIAGNLDYGDLPFLRHHVDLVLEVGVFLLDVLHGLVDVLPDVHALGQFQQSLKTRRLRQVQDALGVVVLRPDSPPARPLAF